MPAAKQCARTRQQMIRIGFSTSLAWADTVQDHCYIRNLRTGFSLCHHKQTPLTQRLHAILWRTRRKTSPEVKPQRGSRQVGWECMYPQWTLCMLGLIQFRVQKGCCCFFLLTALTVTGTFFPRSQKTILFIGDKTSRYTGELPNSLCYTEMLVKVAI